MAVHQKILESWAINIIYNAAGLQVGGQNNRSAKSKIKQAAQALIPILRPGQVHSGSSSTLLRTQHYWALLAQFRSNGIPFIIAYRPSTIDTLLLSDSSDRLKAEDITRWILYKLYNEYTTPPTPVTALTNNCALDFTLDHREAEKRATTPLGERYIETSEGLTHLLSERDHNNERPHILRIFQHEVVDTLRYYKSTDLKKLSSKLCPGFRIDPDGVGERGAMIEVSSENALDVATKWIRDTKLPDGSHLFNDRVLVLNTYHLGEDLGGLCLSGEKGSQEELCYRTSFTLTFPDDGLETGDATGVAYSAIVVIVRGNSDNGHAWCDLSQPKFLDNISIASLGANPSPALTKTTPVRFANSLDHKQMKIRWRNLLRLAANCFHTRLVLSLPGCEHQYGAPVEKIAEWINEVLEEKEFRGCWFWRITFALPERNSNLEKTRKTLHDRTFD